MSHFGLWCKDRRSLGPEEELSESRSPSRHCSVLQVQLQLHHQQSGRDDVLAATSVVQELVGSFV